MDEEKPAASPRRRTKASTVTPTPPPVDWWGIFVRELKIVGVAAGFVTAVILARRYINLAVGEGGLATDLLTGSLPLGDLMTRIEKGVTSHGVTASAPKWGSDVDPDR